MKLLKGQTEVIETENLKISVKVIDTATQAAISDLASDSTIQGRIKMVGFILRNVVSDIEIDGTKYDPKELSAKADISDTETLITMLSIGSEVIKVCFPSGESEKK